MNVKRLKYKLSTLGTLLAIVSLCASFNASAKIAFSKYHLTLDAKHRNTSLTLSNRGNSDNRCEVGFSHQKVMPNGDTQPVSGPDQVFNSADDIIRYSPRRVTLKRASSQTIRLSLKRRRNQQEGEYVSYLRMSCREIVKAAANDDSASDAQVSTLYTRINYNIPVVARIGKLDAELSLSDASYNQGILSVNIHRQGSRSLYGNFKVTDNNTGEVLGELNNYSVYLPVEMRQAQIRLTKEPKGPMLISFEEDPADGGDLKASLTL